MKIKEFEPASRQLILYHFGSFDETIFNNYRAVMMDKNCGD